MENFKFNEPLIKKNNFNENKTITDNNDIYFKSNLISKIFFLWVLPLFRIKKSSLNFDDLGDLDEKNKSEFYLENIKNIWYTKKYKDKKKCPLFLAVMRSNLVRFIILIIYSLIILSLDMISIMIMREYIFYFEKNHSIIIFNTELDILTLGIIYLVTKLISIFLMKQTGMNQAILGYKTGIELSSLIYDKILKVGAQTRAIFTEGELTNLIQIDSNKMGEWLYYVPFCLFIPLQLSCFIYLLFIYLGISFIFGLCTLIIIFIILALMQKKYMIIEENYMNSKDERMRITTQTFNILKILKLYAWENEFFQKILEKRKKEVSLFNSILNFDVLYISIYWSVPVFCSISSIGSYIYFNDGMKISDIIASMTIFTYMQNYLAMVPYFITGLLDTTIALRRIEKLLNQEEIDKTNVEVNEEISKENIDIKLENATFLWSNLKEQSNNIPQTDFSNLILNNKEAIINQDINDIINTQENIININTYKSKEIKETKSNIILSNINLEIKKGELIGIIGDVGSGKSSLLQAILNNMIIISDQITKPKIIINSSVSYVAQNSWIMNETLRNNILFFKEFISDKYDEIIQICQLKEDLELLDGGDMTEIGEKGINLSGGQKTRIAIARALYSDSGIYLLDDPLSALDSEVGMRIFNEVILSYLKGKTRLVATHALQYIKLMDRILYLKEGKIIFSGTYTELKEEKFFQEFYDKSNFYDKNENIIEKINEENVRNYKESTNNEIKRITKDEMKEIGRVKWNVYINYMLYMGGIIIFIVTIFSELIWQSLKIGSDIWLTYWSSIKNIAKEENLNYFLIFSSLALSSEIFTIIRTVIITRGILKMNINLHNKMLDKLIKAPINLFHDTIPKGQIMNRLSKDLADSVNAGFNYGSSLAQLCVFLGSAIICGIYEPLSLIIIPIFMFLSVLLSRLYIWVGRDLYRLEGISRSPILSQFSETISGISSIRAFKYEHHFYKKLFIKMDKSIIVKLFQGGTSEWFALNLDLIFFLFTTFLIFYSSYFHTNYTAQSMGLLLSYSMWVSEGLQYVISEIIRFERSLVSLERCDEYTNIIQEQPYEKDIDCELDSSNWPKKGSIKFTNYFVKYRPDTDCVLKNINLLIKPSEKIGIVGRTGSGKSSLCLGLFRILEAYSGTIHIDDIDISLIGLRKLRSSLTIIPQDPSLIEGTLRLNMDPIDAYTDEEIINILEMIGLTILLKDKNKDNISIDGVLGMKIEENGDNLSIGEKQLICIGRAILRKSKIIVMDEATSSIDIKTESLIQTVMTKVFKNRTVITIAHRIKTIIDYDRILVLSNGEIIEFDSPDNLLNKKNSLFRQLYEKSNI